LDALDRRLCRDQLPRGAYGLTCHV
jgi:hypothetical protein